MQLVEHYQPYLQENTEVARVLVSWQEEDEFALPDPLGVNHDLINARVLILIFLPSSSLLSQRISENWLEAF